MLVGLMAICQAWADEKATTEAEATQKKEKKWHIKPYGFIRNDFYYDSRQNFESAAGLFYMLPYDKDLNEEGDDLNKQSTSRLLSIAARAGLMVEGDDVLGAQTSACFETDFAGFNGSTTMLRIRQAWARMAWPETWTVTMGHTWHPMFGEVVPDVASLATGSPFQPFNRSPQLRVDRQLGRFRLTASALYQLQYASTGPSGTSTDYMVNSKVPEIYLGFDWRKGGLLAGAGLDVLSLAPRTTYETEGGVTVKCNERVNSASFVAFGQYTKGKFAARAKTMFGSNTAHLLMMSGYGVTATSALNGAWDYTPLRNTTTWVDLTYGQRWKGGLFAGYMKNLGSKEALLSSATTYVFGPGNNLAQIWRIAPMARFDMKPISISLEYELTGASYGTLNLRNGRATDTHNVVNNRVVLVAMYYF